MPLNKLKYQPSNPNYNSESVSQTWPSLIEKGKGGLPLKDNSPLKRYAQAVADISGSYYIRYKSAQVNAYILKTNQPAQAQARIRWYSGVAGTTPGLAASITVSKPSEVLENDMMFAYITANNGYGAINSVPDGWIASSFTSSRGRIYYKVATASEPSNYTWGVSPNSYLTGIIVAYRGLDLNDPIYAFGYHSSSSTFYSPNPLINSNSVNGLELLAFHDLSSGSSTVPAIPAPWTRVANYDSGSQSSSAHVSFLEPGGWSPDFTISSLGSNVLSGFYLILHPADTTWPMVRVAQRTYQGLASSASSASVALPFMARSGDTLITAVQYEGQVGSVTSTGWTLVDERNTATGGHYAVLYKRIHNIADEPSSYTFNFNATANWHAITTAVGRDVNSNSNIVVTSAYEYYSSLSDPQLWNVPALTMNARSVLLFVVAANNRGDNNGPSYPFGWPSPYQSLSGGNVAGTSGFGFGVGAGYTNAADPPTFNITASEAQSSQNYAFHVAFMEYIVPTTVVAQSAARITGIEEGYAQAWALIDSPIKVMWAQTNAHIVINDIVAVAQAFTRIKQTYQSYAQSQVRIKAIYQSYAQAEAYVIGPQAFAQAEAYIDSPITRISVYAQALAFIGLIVSQSGQVNASILTTYFVSAQSIANIKQTYQQYNQSQGQILQTYNVVAQAQTDILQTYNVFAQAQAQILVTYNAFAQAETFIFYIQQVWAQANADILSSIVTRNAHAQANADILATYTQVSQAQGTVLQTYNLFAQAQTSILQTYFVVSQAQAHVVVRTFVFSQAQTSILAQNNSFANAGTTILATYNAWAQGQATVLQTYNSYAQAQAFIIYQIQAYGQAEGFILLVFSQSAQVQGTVLQTYNQGAQVNVLIDSPYHYEYAQANASIAALIFKDTFTRVQSAGDLGTPDIGPDYGDATGEYTYTTADGSVGITTSTVDYDGTYATVPIPHKNILTSIDFKVGYTPWATYAQINVRRNDAGTARVDAYIYDDDGVNGTHRLRITDWRSTPTSYDLILSNNTWYTLKFLTIANNAYAKVWERGTPEPDWQTSKTIPEDSGTNYFAFYQDCGETPHTQQQFDNFLAFEVYTPTARMFAQAKTRILRTNINVFAQAKTWIIPTTVVAQAKAQMLAFNINKFGLARPRIKVVNNNKVSQAQARMILGRFRNYSQALALIVVRDIEKIAQANTLIDSPIKVQSGNASVWIRNTYNSFAQALAMRAERYSGSGHTQTYIKSFPKKYAHVMGRVKQNYDRCANVQSIITRLTVHQHAQATVLILRSNFAQTQAKIVAFGWLQQAQVNAYVYNPFGFSQAQAFIRKTNKYGLARAKIISNLNISVRANVRAHILKLDTSVFAQVQANIDSTGRQQWAQAGAKIETTRVHGQANAHVKNILNLKQAQTIATIKFTTQGYAQSKAMIKSPLQSGNSQAYIHTQSVQFAQALTQIGSFKYGQAQSYIYSPVYLVKYNNHVLPGYAQHEALISSARIIDHYASPANGSLSEYIGLENKIISLRMRVVSEDYRGAKGQISRAGTILRSSHTWEKLYIHNSDRHYLALGKTVKMENTADKSGKVVDYDIEWHAKPWVISDQTYTVTGTGTVAVNRTLANGGWTPATINITGTNVTVSGYTEYGEFAGFISVSGYVANLIVTSEPFEATINGVNSIARIKNPDYAMYIGPGTTYIVTTGATNCIITYNDRWSL